MRPWDRDPYAQFTITNCGASAVPPSDATPVLRNARNPVWETPCQCKIEAGTPAALALARLVCEAGGTPWESLSRYVSEEEARAASGPVRLHVCIKDKDPGEQSDDLIGAADIELGELEGEVKGLVLPCDPELIRQQAQRDEEAQEATLAALREAYDKRVREARAKGVAPPRPPPALRSPQASGRLSAGNGSSRLRASQRRAALERPEAITPATISFSFAFEEFVPPPPATLLLTSIEVVKGLDFAVRAAPGSSEAVDTKRKSKGSTPQAMAESSGTSRRFNTKLFLPSPRSAPERLDLSKLGAPYLRAVLLEIPDGAGGADATVAATPPIPEADAPSAQPWSEALLILRLARGAPRPPLVRIQLCDRAREEAVEQKVKDKAKSQAAKEAAATTTEGGAPSSVRVPPVAEMELRLQGSSGSTEVALDYPYKSGGGNKVKQVLVRLTFELREDQASEDRLAQPPRHHQRVKAGHRQVHA